MAKTKKASLHSRAARRGAGTPPPKDLASIPRAEEDSVHKQKIDNAIQRLGVSPGSGISKKKTKKLSHKQRKRREAGIERAEAVVEKLAKKVEGGVARHQKVIERSGEWEKLNEKIEIEVGQVEVGLQQGKISVKDE